MAVDSQGELIDALARENYGLVLGTPESHWVDFKRDPYQLDGPKDQWELAKDVAAMAANRGGLIVIGYATRRLINEGLEVADEHHPVPKRLISPQRYKDLIQSRVYPPVRDIQTRWYPPGEDQDVGVFLIEIPPQPEDEKPFAVTRMLDEAEDHAEHSNFVGFPVRDGDRAVWMTPEAIHHHMNVGRRLNAPGLPSDTQRDISPDALDAEVLAAVEAVGAEEDPWLVLQANIAGGADAHDSFVLEQLRATLATPPSLRPSGFNFNHGGASEWIGGSVIQIVSRASLRFSDAGILTACFPATEECLCWAVNQHSPQGSPRKINPLALVEYTLEYFRLLDLQVANLYRGSWKAVLKVRGARESSLVLAPGELQGIEVFAAAPYASDGQEDDWISRFDCEGDAEKDAFAALVRTYSLFGLSESEVPYADGGRILSSRIAKS